MSREFPELDRLKMEVSPTTRLVHLNAIRTELHSVAPSRRRWKLMVVAVAILLTLPVLALAAQRAEPGDFLYPVREVVDWVTDSAPVRDVTVGNAGESVPRRFSPAAHDITDERSGEDFPRSHTHETVDDRVPAEDVTRHPEEEVRDGGSDEPARNQEDATHSRVTDDAPLEDRERDRPGP